MGPSHCLPSWDSPRRAQTHKLPNAWQISGAVATSLPAGKRAAKRKKERKKKKESTYKPPALRRETRGWRTRRNTGNSFILFCLTCTLPSWQQGRLEISNQKGTMKGFGQQFGECSYCFWKPCANLEIIPMIFTKK